MSYTSKDIQVLDEISHIRLNPSMYVGDTSTPTHLLEEVLDNSLDECFGGHAKIVAIIIDTKKEEYSVIDSGRGIPYDNNAPITISTKLFSGSKFKGSKDVYKICCLTGDNKILLTTGENITIKEMVDNPNKIYLGLSLNKEGLLETTYLLYPQITGYTKKLIKIILDNDELITCTEDHKFMLIDQTYIEANKLKQNDSLMSCYYKENNSGYLDVRTVNEKLNHKVKKIEILNLENEVPVYDIYVPENSNFVLLAGIVVHNSGLHGIGLSAVNSLSSNFSIEIYRDKHALFSFEDCKLKEDKIEEFDGDKPFSTKVSFKPDKKFFQSTIIDIDRIRKRLLIASVELPDVHFVIIINNKKEIIKLDKDKFFKEVCLTSNDTNYSNIYNFSSKDNKEEFNSMFCYSFSGSTSPKIISSVNLLPIDEGGTHINIFIDLLKEFFISKSKKSNFKFQSSDCLCGLRAYISLELLNPEYSSQSKDKLTNKREYLLKLTNRLEKEIEMYFSKNLTELGDLLKFFDDYRSKLDSKKLKGNNNGRRSSTKMTKLRDCKLPNGELYIVEGDSAGGNLIQSRNINIHAIFPLKGKIPNIMNAKDILKNKEVSELIQALGCGYGQNFDINKLKYSKIIAAVDADKDGGHIFVLLCMVIVILFPEIIKSGKFYYAETPLFSINEPKEFRPLWTDEEVEKARNEKRTILRAKGLGELSPEQIKICLMNEKTRKLIKIDYTNNIEKMIKLFTDPNEKRKLLKEEIEW